MRKRSLPVLNILKSAFLVTAEKSQSLVRGLSIASISIILLEFLSQSVSNLSEFQIFLIFIIPTGFVFTLFAITCHRIVLIGPECVPKFGMYKWSSREWRFLGWTVLAYVYLAFVLLLLAIPGIIVATMFDVGGGFSGFVAIAWYVFAFYVFARISILFPATAVDDRRNISWAFHVTEGFGWRLVVIVGFLPMILGWCVEYLRGYNPILDITVAILGVIFLAVEIAALSLTYKFLVLEGS